MKVNQLLLTEEQQLIREFNIKHALAAGAVGAALSGAPSHVGHEQPASRPQVVLPAPKAVNPVHEKMAEKISSKYSVDFEDAMKIVELAHKYEKPTFPTAKDILAIIGVESGFDPDAVSGLKRDPAMGLMQVRPGIWNINPRELEGNVEKQIAYGSEILHLYYKKLKNPQSAVAAFNVGMGEFRSGNKAHGYVSKYKHELNQYGQL